MSFLKWLIVDVFHPESKQLFFLRKFVEKISKPELIYDLDELAFRLEIDKDLLKKWIYSAPDGYEYKDFKIKKRRAGYRLINSPNPPLKKLQKTVYHKLLKPISYPRPATAFIKERSIVNNAIPHVDQEVVINIDLLDFFGHINSNKIYQSWNSLGWDVESATILKNICTYNGVLPQGAPTSPAISNLCNMRLDERFAALAKTKSGQYTRYSDDLTFSFPKFNDSHRGIIQAIGKILRDEGYKIQKKKKIRIQRPHQRQTTTGLVVNKKISLPRSTRHKIRAMMHHEMKGTLSDKDKNKLHGYRSLLQMLGDKNISIITKKYPFDLSTYSNKKITPDVAVKIVKLIISQFKDLIENKGVWKELWKEDKTPRKEKTAQQLFYVIAYSYCRANDLDLTPEANSGNGPVDFKISQGYKSKIIVELKLSTNTSLVHGYEKQLEIYKKADDSDLGFFLVIDVGSLGEKLRKIEESRRALLACHHKASDIFYVDGKYKKSASKR